MSGTLNPTLTEDANHSMNGLHGRVAIVTGAAQGIGQQIALRLALDGFDVAICDLQSKNEALEQVAQAIRDQGRKSIALIGDVSKEEEVKTLVATTVRELGGVDVMVANAGVIKINTLLESSVEEYQQMFSVNVVGTMLCYKHAALQMIEQGRGGRLIGASSIAGKKGHATFGAYGATKFAIRGITQCAAQELGKYGITANTYVPGIIDTPMSQTIEEAVTTTAPAKLLGMSVTNCFSEIVTKSAMGKLIAPTDIASLVSFLASKESQFITGQSIVVDGGYLFD